MVRTISCVSMILLHLSGAARAAPTLAVPEIFQEQTNWCWAATSHCVIEYYGTEAIQCEIVNYTLGYTRCCDDLSSCNYPNCICGNGCIDYAIEGWNFATGCTYDSLSMTEMEAELNLYQPFIIFRARSGTGHVIVGHGISEDENEVYAMDPWMTEGYVIIDYDYLLSGGGSWWDTTVLMAEQPECICPEVSDCCDGCRPWADGTACQIDHACLLPDGQCQAGSCVGAPVEDGLECDDLNPCTQSDSCQAGVCTGDDPVSCPPQSQCRLEGVCDPATGLCSDPLADDGSACDDGNPCTLTDSCQAGSCMGADPLECTPLSQCHLAGTCDPGTGECSNHAKENGTACDDSDLCTQSDSCQEGACLGVDPVICSASDQCHRAGECHPATGVCSDPLQEDGAACDDGDLCTQTDGCQSGVCLGSDPLECSPSDQCHRAGVCDPLTGQCSDPAAEDGTSCDDDDLCTRLDTCREGVCVGQAPVVCEPRDSCHQAGSCDPLTGQCSNPVKPDGAECDDGDRCTKHNVCQAGVCSAGDPLNCDDGDPCTENDCDPQDGCIFTETDCPSTTGCGCTPTGDAGAGAVPGLMLCLGLLVSLRRRKRIG